MCLVQCTHIPASVAKFCSRPCFLVNRTVWWTHIWNDKIRCVLLNELVSFTRVKWRKNASFPSMSEFIVMLLLLKSSSLSLPLSSWQSFPLGSKPAENFGARGTEERSNDEPSRILLKMSA